MYDTSKCTKVSARLHEVYRNKWTGPSKGQHAEIASGVFSGDDAANQWSGTEAAAEEDTFDAVAVADELNALHQVQYHTVQQRKRQVFSLELTTFTANSFSKAENQLG